MSPCVASGVGQVLWQVRINVCVVAKGRCAWEDLYDDVYWLTTRHKTIRVGHGNN